MDIINTSNFAKSTRIGMAKPKRPLSAYNLFWRFKRQKIIKLTSSSSSSTTTCEKLSCEDIIKLIECPPGLEESVAANNLNLTDETDEVLNANRRANILMELEGHRMARDTQKRAHRKDTELSGAISFSEMGKLMNSNWKSCDELGRSVFLELAEEGREVYRSLVKEYHERAKALGITPPKQKKKAAGKRKKAIANNALLPPVVGGGGGGAIVSSTSSDMSEHDLAEMMLKLSKTTASQPPVAKKPKFSGPMQGAVTNGGYEHKVVGDIGAAPKMVIPVVPAVNLPYQNPPTAYPVGGVHHQADHLEAMQNQQRMVDLNTRQFRDWDYQFGKTPSYAHQMMSNMRAIESRTPVSVQPDVTSRVAAMQQQLRQNKTNSGSGATLSQEYHPSPLYPSSQDQLMYRVRALENQLAEERMRSQLISSIQSQLIQRNRAGAQMQGGAGGGEQQAPAPSIANLHHPSAAAPSNHNLNMQHGGGVEMWRNMAYPAHPFQGQGQPRK